MCKLVTGTRWTKKETLRQARGEGVFFSTPPVTVYLTVSDPQEFEKGFKFNDVSLQKIIEWE